ncbi:hypothetical protein MSL71_15100 [Desulfoluna butyratoxydans]|uniref:Uncharacterized protein n=1 Tax=Desulfoluna butyratoxydans TaxID=231438 RepID=A0A4V6IL62_9BACT|nr:hypothetical protein MSL71_15100 [Desulfoluna butyratoxydans]
MPTHNTGLRPVCLDCAKLIGLVVGKSHTIQGQYTRCSICDWESSDTIMIDSEVVILSLQKFKSKQNPQKTS